MGDPIINTQVDAINTTLGNIKVDLAALRPSIRAIKDAIAETYLTDTIENVPIASFSDGADEIPVRELQVAIEPVQSLNGQTSPYPAGGGKNLLPPQPISGANSGITVSSNNGVYTVSGTPSAYVQFISPDTFWLEAGTYTLRSNKSVSGNYWSVQIRSTDGLTTYANSADQASVFTLSAKTELKFRFAINTGESGTKTFAPQIEVGSTATAYAPYSNICPISGHTEVNVYRAGKNLFDKDAVSVGVYLSTTTGLEEAAASYVTTDYIPVQANEAVYIPSSGTTRRWFYDKNKTPKTFINYSGAQAYTPTEDGYIRVSVRVAGSPTIDLSTYQIELGSTATAYEPYAGQTYPISLGQTVYGGTLNVTTGELTIDRAMVDLGTLSWSYNSTNLFFTATIADMENKYNYASDVTDVIMSIAKYKGARVAWANMANGDFGVNAKDIRLKLTDYTSTAALIAAITGQQLVYPLATPTTVQLTAAEVETLFGDNNIWSSTGDVIKLVYRQSWEHWLAEQSS